MNHNVYLLATDPNNPCRDVIHSRDTQLRVRVFCMDDEDFHADAGELQLFGKCHGKFYAFETIGVASEDALDIVEAIQWYASYVKCPDMEIMPDDPRLQKDKNLAM